MAEPLGRLELKAIFSPSGEKAGWLSPVPLSSVTFTLSPPSASITQMSVPLECSASTVPLKAILAPSGDQEGSLLTLWTTLWLVLVGSGST